jgi:hypothetical protein
VCCSCCWACSCKIRSLALWGYVVVMRLGSTFWVAALRSIFNLNSC